jgi:hypothetical protein
MGDYTVETKLLSTNFLNSQNEVIRYCDQNHTPSI